MTEPCDVLIIPGGPEWERLIKDDRFLDVVRQLTERARSTASVCTGAFLLAAAGLLDGRRATTHWRDAGQLALRFPAVQVEPDAIFVQDGPVMTSAGVSAGIDLSLALVEKHYGAPVARAVAKDMVVFMQRPGGQSQFSARSQAPHTRNEMLRRILDAVVADPAGSHTVPAMARRAGLSARQVTRLFADEVGITRPATWSRSGWKPPRRCWRPAMTPWRWSPGGPDWALRSRCGERSSGISGSCRARTGPASTRPDLHDRCPKLRPSPSPDPG